MKTNLYNLTCSGLIAVLVPLVSGACAPDDCLDPTKPCPWPAEALSEATNLTAIEGDESDNDFYRNLSGAAWNATTESLWVARNGPDERSKVWQLRADGAGSFEIYEPNGKRAEWTGFGDLEAITDLDQDQDNQLYGLDEATGSVHLWQLDPDEPAPALLESWDLSSALPDDEAQGAEGLCFVPNDDLSDGGFVDEAGEPYQSQGPLGGVFLVGHQNGGALFAFDLLAEGQWSLVGTYLTGLDETAGLEWSSSTG